MEIDPLWKTWIIICTKHYFYGPEQLIFTDAARAKDILNF